MMFGQRRFFSCESGTDGAAGCSCTTRRGFVASLGALGASAALPMSRAMAQAPGPVPKRARIDTHYHYFPTPYLGPLEEWWTANSARGPLPPFVKNWSVAKALEEMDEGDVATGIASLPIPGARLKADNESMRRLARVSNEFGARMAQEHRGRFGLFATLPIPDVEGSLKEIEYALDTLKADGIGMMTSWDNIYPGDASLLPIFEEFNRRKAAVYFHPMAPACCGGVVPGINEGFLEYPFDTGRAILSLLVSGAFTRFHDTRFIFSHAGGPTIMLAGRIESLASRRPDFKQKLPEGVQGELRRLFYDTANSAFPPDMAALLAYVPVSQVLFGSDTPYVSIAENVKNFSALDLPESERKVIERGNALKLFPRLAA